MSTYSATQKDAGFSLTFVWNFPSSIFRQQSHALNQINKNKTQSTQTVSRYLGISWVKKLNIKGLLSEIGRRHSGFYNKMVYTKWLTCRHLFLTVLQIEDQVQASWLAVCENSFLDPELLMVPGAGSLLGISFVSPIGSALVTTLTGDRNTYSDPNTQNSFKLPFLFNNIEFGISVL